ncbi:MAG: Outer rane efflux protein, partial [Rhizobacter sp.]|nr:Outer rane efflux protein [Rhizobacter sp.]
MSPTFIVPPLRVVRLAALPLLLGLMGTGAALAETFVEKTDRLLSEPSWTRSASTVQPSDGTSIGPEKNAWVPRVSLNPGSGPSLRGLDAGLSGRINPRLGSLGVNQLITDFGTSDARAKAVERNADKHKREEALLRQNLLFSAVEAQLLLVRAIASVHSAQQLERNVQRQTSTDGSETAASVADDAQASARLAAAKLRTVEAERVHEQAVDRYAAVFGSPPPSHETQDGLAAPIDWLPKTADELDRLAADDGNPDIAAAAARTEASIAQRAVQRARESMPRIDLQAGSIRREGIDSTRGAASERKLLLRLAWSFDVGLSAADLTEVADQAVAAALDQEEVVRLQAREEGRAAWAAWVAAGERARRFVHDQSSADVALRLARLDCAVQRCPTPALLDAEFHLFNAKSDAADARIDEVLAAYRVLRVAGRMSQAMFSV